jgi:hypothetical protein
VHRVESLEVFKLQVGKRLIVAMISGLIILISHQFFVEDSGPASCTLACACCVEDLQ